MSLMFTIWYLYDFNCVAILFQWYMSTLIGVFTEVTDTFLTILTIHSLLHQLSGLICLRHSISDTLYLLIWLLIYFYFLFWLQHCSGSVHCSMFSGSHLGQYSTLLSRYSFIAQFLRVRLIFASIMTTNIICCLINLQSLWLSNQLCRLILPDQYLASIMC